MMAKKNKKKLSVAEHMKKIRPLGYKARLKKYGPDYMRDLVNKRWAKKRAEDQKKQEDKK